MNRRSFCRSLTLAAAGSMAQIATGAPQPNANTQRRMRLCLAPGSIGVRANQRETVALAEKHGFESVEPFPGELAPLSAEEQAQLLDSLQAKGLVWGAAGLPLEFRQDQQRFEDGLRELPKAAKALERVGASRVGTWISPTHSSLTYLGNFKRHATRLRSAAEVLKDHGQRLGLEYVGTKTSRDGARFPFIHTLAELRELIAEIGTGNVGVVLDSWHWWQAGDSVEDLRVLRNDDIVSVDLNDAPTGVAKEEQRDNRRELPVATGVIPVGAFLGVLRQIGYDGPVRAEPFNRAVNELENDPACAATIAALRKAMESTA